MEYTTSTYNSGLGYSQSINNIATPAGNTTVIQNSDILGNNQVITTHQDSLGHYSQEYATHGGMGPPSPVDVASVHSRTYGSPPRAIITNRSIVHPHSPVVTHQPAVNVGYDVYHPAPPLSSLKLTSSPCRKPITTTRTNFMAGMTEELMSDPMGPPPPFPGETVAVTTTSGVGCFTKACTRIDPISGYQETYVNQKNPVRTYTTTVYEDGDVPRTYTTTFEDQPALPPVPTITSTSTTTFAAHQSTVLEPLPGGEVIEQHHLTSSPVSVHRTAVMMSPARMTKVTTTRSGLHGVQTTMGYI